MILSLYMTKTKPSKKKNNKTKEFLAQFSGLNNSLIKASSDLADHQSAVLTLEKRVKDLRFITEALCDLRNPPSAQSDPGKYSKAFYFVDKFVGEGEDRDIFKSNSPSMQMDCPHCNGKHHVLMWYKQTSDSPELDLWTKQAFYICFNQIYPVERVVRDYRF